MAVKSKGKGKSGGVRIITNVIIRITEKEENTKVIGLITIYDKSEFENISDKEIEQLISELSSEIEDIDNE